MHTDGCSFPFQVSKTKILERFKFVKINTAGINLKKTKLERSSKSSLDLFSS